MSACHSVSRSPDTWTARRGFFQLPNVSRGSVSLPAHRSFPPQSCVYAECRRVAVCLCSLMTRWVVIPFVQAQVLRLLLGGRWPRHHYGIKCCIKQLGVVTIRSCYDHRERSTPLFHQQAPLYSILPSVCGVATHRVPPKRALPIAASAACHSQLTPPSSSHSSTKVAQRRSNTPTATHLWNVRCTELSSGNSLGNWFHWQPLRILNMMASSAPRAAILLRPLGLGGSNSIMIGLTWLHNSSGTRQMVGIAARSFSRSFFGLPICIPFLQMVIPYLLLLR